MSDDDTQDLKLCPFCGGKPQIERKGTARRSQIIYCEDCGARHECGDIWGIGEPQWNQRWVCRKCHRDND